MVVISGGPRAVMEDGHAERHCSPPDVVMMCITRQRPLAGLLWRRPVVGVVRTSPVPTLRSQVHIGCCQRVDRDCSMDPSMH